MTVQKIKSAYLDANTFVVSQNNQCIIIDSGAPLQDVEKAVQCNKVLAILLTHGHFDHSIYCLDYAKKFNCSIYMHANAKLTLASPERNYGAPFFINKFESFSLIDGNGILQIKDFLIHYFETPGHSPCSMCYQIENALFAGDTLFANGIGRTDLIGSDKSKMQQSLQLLSTLQFDNAYSGHGEDSDFARQTRNIHLYQKFLAR